MGCAEARNLTECLCTIAGVQLGVMPGAARLKTVPTMSEADKNESAESETEDRLAKANVLSASTPTVVVAPGIPALPKKLAQKILNGE